MRVYDWNSPFSWTVGIYIQMPWPHCVTRLNLDSSSTSSSPWVYQSLSYACDLFFKSIPLSSYLCNAAIFAIALHAGYDIIIRLQHASHGKMSQAFCYSQYLVLSKSFHFKEVMVFFTTTRVQQQKKRSIQTHQCAIMHDQFISYTLVAVVPSSCNITLSYNQSSRRLMFINSTWDTVLVSHLYECGFLGLITLFAQKWNPQIITHSSVTLHHIHQLSHVIYLVHIYCYLRYYNFHY